MPVWIVMTCFVLILNSLWQRNRTENCVSDLHICSQLCLLTNLIPSLQIMISPFPLCLLSVCLTFHHIPLWLLVCLLMILPTLVMCLMTIACWWIWDDLQNNIFSSQRKGVRPRSSGCLKLYFDRSLLSWSHHWKG